ncbi:DUF1566 domain-containing protein [Marinomonas rhizomae]|uniref:Lcl domain-containing protein n=1 Tax=Marinomonas rhizomae TaxID=491948 RepID=UPI002106BEE8|nr:DUF1566 domain-containing protein [Marinomonas rhizomae]UTW01236.1 DUF1566 domain-containing protein [Marinomonas rhizomae]
MADFPGLQMTAAGRDLQAKAQTGVKLDFTRAAIGDGAMPDDFDPLTALVAEKKSLGLAGFELLGDGTSKLEVLLTNKDVAEGFFIREIGVFANDPDTDTEILYSYSNVDRYTDYLPAFGGATIVEMTFDLYTVVGNASNVTATINNYLVHATKSDVDELRPYVLPTGGTVGMQLRRASNTDGDNEWYDPTEGVQLRIHSVSEERTAVEGQTAFALSKTLTNGLAVYVNGLRLPNSDWSAVGGSQVVLDNALTDGDKVQFINNEEVGTASLARVSLDGPDLVYQGSSNHYTITDYDRFSNYVVTTNVGTATRVNGVITLDVPADAAVNDGIVLTVQRNDGAMSFSIALGEQTIAQPQITSPEHNATDISDTPTFTASAFQTYPANADTQITATWRLATDGAMTNVIWESVDDAVNLTAITLPREVLEESTTYYVDVFYSGTAIGSSAHSEVISFVTKSRFMEILRPSITAPNHNALDVGETPTLVASAFETYPADSDTHVSTTWRVATDAAMTNVIWQSSNDTVNLTSITIPADVLPEATTFYVDVMQEGEILGDSEPSILVGFTTADQYLPSVIGEPWGGGYYAGIIDSGSLRYVLIVAPRSSGHSNQSLQYKVSDTEDLGALSHWDGKSNTAAINDAFHPAAQFCSNLNIGGFNDWYLPARDELELLYRNLKSNTLNNSLGSRDGGDNQGENSNSDPLGIAYTSVEPAQSVALEFKFGGFEYFASGMYWSSTEGGAGVHLHWWQSFQNGQQRVFNRIYEAHVRAVRRILI